MPLVIAHLKKVGCMRDVMFIDNNTSIRSDLEMRRSGRNEAPIVVGVYESSKLSSIDYGEDIEKREEQVEDYLIPFQEPKRGP